MGKTERHAYLKAIRLRYRRAKRKAKTLILDEFCAVAGTHRKYAIRLLNQRPIQRKPKWSGRKPIYGDPNLLKALKRIWFACAPRNLKQFCPSGCLFTTPNTAS